MKFLFLFFIFLKFINFSSSQDIIIRKYNSGQVSLKETTTYWPEQSKNFREQKVEVFNKNGEIVYSGVRRNYAGHSSIDLSFYKNGGVSKIVYSSAPDAGIQWYKGQYLLDENGNIIDKFEDSYDKQHTTLLHQLPFKHDELPQINPNLKPNTCAVPKRSDFYFINLSKKSIEILVDRKQNTLFSNKFKSLNYNDTLKVEFVTNAEKFINPKDYFEVFIKKSKKINIERYDLNSFALKEFKISESHLKLYYYFVDF
jgi:hypothetical protein